MGIFRTVGTCIIFHFLRYCNRSQHIKSEVELPVTLAVKKIMYRTDGTIPVSISHLIGHIHEHLWRIRFPERLRRGFYQNDDSFLASFIGSRSSKLSSLARSCLENILSTGKTLLTLLFKHLPIRKQGVIRF